MIRTDTWRPIGARSKPAKDIEPGMIVAIDYAGFRHKPWRVHEVREQDEDRVRLYLRPVGAQYDLAEYNKPIAAGKRLFIPVLNEHYSVCGKCGDLQPCAEVWSERVASEEAERAARFEVEGICPACEEPVTARQKSYRFEENIRALLGPPVVFHQRKKCWPDVVHYDAELARLHDRQPALSCIGMQTRHQDGGMECTNAQCPGSDKQHRGFRQCFIAYGDLQKCERPGCQ
ncbi:hypothetical protein QBL02_13155 [Leucobacter sp. UT-8R-CII-1-4]|uniref:hypothetical protein n=1 Tax=Leucobacter sp. UT-8R-CII-1-4 TaxID=3040075 RepID=UPI0024A9A72E|nr:hypothetical protein [Leucobacter sp. UT-8R-CII-1-4]MDI6024489.1 hypothetical protein [Leucobacter sp. UT-8R-CII-1-4]